MTPKAIVALANGCPGLTSITLSEWADSTMTAELAALADKCPDLTHIDLSYCECINTAALNTLATGFPNLRSVDLCSCDAVTDLTVAALVKGCLFMTSFISLHLGNDFPRTMVPIGEFIQVPIKMLANFFFGCGNKTKTHPIAHQAGCGANDK